MEKYPSVIQFLMLFLMRGKYDDSMRLNLRVRRIVPILVQNPTVCYNRQILPRFCQ